MRGRWAAELEWERGTGNWVAQGRADAGVNGFTNGANGVTVAVVQQATYGDYSGYYDVLQVTVSQQVSTIFMGTLNGGTVTISAQAQALMPPCGYFTAAASLGVTYTFDGASSGTYPVCPLYINKNLVVDGFATLDAYAINVAGASSSSTIQGSMYPAARYNAATVPDPLASVVSPSFSSCSHTSYSLSSGSATLDPGTYCGTSSTKGMTLSSATVTMNPGLYIVTGGAHWTTSTVTGTGVTIFFTHGNGAGYGQFIFDSNSRVHLSAPVDTSGGGLTAILFFGDRNWVHTSAEDFQCSNSLFVGDGIWYTTGTGISNWSCGSLYGPNYLAMVTDNIYTFGTTLGLKSNFSNIPTGNPFRTQAVLVQ